MSASARQSENGIDLVQLRDAAAQVLAHSVTDQFPGAKLGVGSATQDGFYYDFELPRSLVPDDLHAIESRMREIIAEDFPFVRREVSNSEARSRFAQQPYKLEILDDLEREGATISTCRHDGFEDLSDGPHLAGTGEIPADALRLTHVSGAYWRGDERNPMLQRIHGTAWANREALETHLWRQEEATRRDHRTLGRELDLFSTSQEVGPGLILWHPKGAAVRLVMEDFMRAANVDAGYEWVFTPHIGRAHLWETSGHLRYFADSMYPPMEADGDEYYVKPMNCPFHTQIFASRPRSYRELPLRLAENGAVYRYERSGVLHGLTRTRGFTVDDAHIFCRVDQVEGEIEATLQFALDVLRAFGMTDFQAELSTRPTKAVGEPADWERATAALRRAIDRLELPWRLDEGGGAFYGPKISFILRDAIGREWQCGTIQFDFNLPERFGLEYTGDDGKQHRPYMVHRALMGSIERFFGVLIEHYAGAFPLWLAPVQAVVIPIGDRHAAYAERVKERLRRSGLRVETDLSGDRMQAKIREAQLQKVPYMLVVGDREQAVGGVSVRLRSGEDLGVLSVSDVLARMTDEMKPPFPRRRREEDDWNGRCC